jgi:uncharacterized protein
MPLIESKYLPPRLLRGGHRQTILANLLRRPKWSWPEPAERLELADGDFLDLYWCCQPRAERLVIFLHGLEGSAQASYIRSMAQVLSAQGWACLAWNYRGCGGVENRLRRFYHSGETGDVRAVVDHALAQGYERVAFVGFSLGGNLALKALSEAPAHPQVRAAVAISAPVDLPSSSFLLDEEPGNWLYQQRFLRSLKQKALDKAQRYPELRAMLAGEDGIRAVKNIKRFDERITAPLHGFPDADAYWYQCSAIRSMAQLRTPSLLLSSMDDPLLAAPSFPVELARTHSHLFLEACEYGGHLGFLNDLDPRLSWHEKRTQEFLSEWF